LVQAFLKKWWVESDFKAPNLPLSLRFKGSGSWLEFTTLVVIGTDYTGSVESNYHMIMTMVAPKMK
jgi:hypothetical protein